jgi:hypothetical protein
MSRSKIPAGYGFAKATPQRFLDVGIGGGGAVSIAETQHEAFVNSKSPNAIGAADNVVIQQVKVLPCQLPGFGHVAMPQFM